MKIKLIVLSIIFAFLIGVAIEGIIFYKKIYSPNVNTGNKKAKSLIIPTGSTVDSVFKIIQGDSLLIDFESFIWLSEIKKYKKAFPGHYIVKQGMNNNELVNMLRAGLQTPVKLTFNNIRTIEELAGIVSGQIEADSIRIRQLLNDEEFIDSLGFEKETIASIFIPDTYEFYWNTSAKKFILKMHEKYQNYWTPNRESKAKEAGLSKTDVSILASIVQAEQRNHNDEKPIIAGLYINRLKRRMPLQSDPTLIFAKGDFTINRVLNEDKKINSPYNTYLHAGLPPGPINLPEKSSLEAVLNFNKNDYLFMCAKEDFSGYHYFSKTMRQHSKYARKYQRALNKKRIYR